MCVVRDLDLSVGTGRGEVERGNIADLYVACQGFLTDRCRLPKSAAE